MSVLVDSVLFCPESFRPFQFHTALFRFVLFSYFALYYVVLFFSIWLFDLPFSRCVCLVKKCVNEMLLSSQNNCVCIRIYIYIYIYIYIHACIYVIIYVTVNDRKQDNCLKIKDVLKLYLHISDDVSDSVCSLTRKSQEYPVQTSWEMRKCMQLKAFFDF